MIIKRFCLIAIINLVVCNVCFSYDDINTHPALTLAAIKTSSIDAYLFDNFNEKFKLKTESQINGRMVRDWLTKGSTDEDAPNCRAASHFLDPLKNWDKAGLSDTNQTILGIFIINPACFVTAPISSRSPFTNIPT